MPYKNKPTFSLDFNVCDLTTDVSCSQYGNVVKYPMRVIAVKTLKAFWERHPDAEGALRAWYTEARRANWRSPQDIKNAYRTASFIRNNRIVFNIMGNSYRLIVAIKYDFQIVYIRFIGTHAAYDRVNAEEI